MKNLKNVTNFFRRILITNLILLLCIAAYSQDPLFGYLDLHTPSTQTINVGFNYNLAEYDNTYQNHWRITSTNGYMEFAFNGNYDFSYHVLGSTSDGVSYCYIDIYVNGIIYASNVFIDKNWDWREIPSSAFTSGANTVRLVLVGNTQLWIDRVNYGYCVDLTTTYPQSMNVSFNYNWAEYDNTYQNHWRIISTNGYMEFAFNGNYSFSYNVLGSTSDGVSYCYIDIYVNGIIYASNVFIDKNWDWREIPSSAFTSSANTVKLVLVGNTQLWVDMIGLTSPLSLGEDCSNPVTISGTSGNVNYSTTGYIDDYYGSCISNSSEEKVYYLSTPVPNGYSIEFWTTGDNYDVVLYGRRGSCTGTEIACVDDPDGTVLTWVNNTGINQNIWLFVDGYGGSDGSATLNWNIAPSDTPCENIIALSNCGSGYLQTFIGGGTGVWNTNTCGYSTPGLEQIYSFVAPVTGTYSLTVSSASGYVDYSWQASNCSETGWTCIDDIASVGTYGSMSWIAGTTYYILLDDEDATTGTHQFYINCPASNDYITITTPNSSTNWQAGTTDIISWSDNVSENVIIDLYKESLYQFQITPSTPSDGSRAWDLPDDLVSGTDYQIKITSTTNGSVYDFSEPFEILALGTFQIINPANGAINLLLTPTLIWDYTEHVNGIEYDIWWEIGDNAYALIAKTTDKQLDLISESTLQQLQYNTNYCWYVTLSDNSSIKSEVACFTTMDESDKNPPTINITSPYNYQGFASSNITVSGTASDIDGYVSLVQVNVNNGSWQNALGTTNWTTNVTLEEGNNTIYAKAQDDEGEWSTTASVSNLTTALNETPFTNSIKIYPNPTNGKLNIETDIDIEYIKIYSLQGSLLYESSFKPDVNISNFDDGIYLLKLYSKKDKVLLIKKIMVNK